MHHRAVDFDSKKTYVQCAKTDQQGLNTCVQICITRSVNVSSFFTGNQFCIDFFQHLLFMWHYYHYVVSLLLMWYHYYYYYGIIIIIVIAGYYSNI